MAELLWLIVTNILSRLLHNKEQLLYKADLPSVLIVGFFLKFQYFYLFFVFTQNQVVT